LAIWIRKISNEKSENFLKLAKDDWNLKTQFEVFESWLKSEAVKLNPSDAWIADIGFSSGGCATGGVPVISLEIMEICLAHKITIYLSEYSDDA